MRCRDERDDEDECQCMNGEGDQDRANEQALYGIIMPWGRGRRQGRIRARAGDHGNRHTHACR